MWFIYSEWLCFSLEERKLGDAGITDDFLSLEVLPCGLCTSGQATWGQQLYDTHGEVRAELHGERITITPNSRSEQT